MNWDPVHDGRRAFLACLWAFCEPGTPIEGVPRPHLHEDAVLDGAAAVLLAMLDPGLGLAVFGGIEAERLGESLCRLTGASPVQAEEASFVLVADGVAEPVAARATRGSALEPERGATIVYAGRWSPVEASLQLAGRSGRRRVELAMPMAELDAIALANAEPPAGIDAFVVGSTSIRGLPRSATLVGEVV